MIQNGHRIRSITDQDKQEVSSIERVDRRWTTKIEISDGLQHFCTYCRRSIASSAAIFAFPFFKLKIEYFALFLAITLVLALIVNSSLEIRFCSPSRKCQGEILLFNDLFSKLNMLNV